MPGYYDYFTRHSPFREHMASLRACDEQIHTLTARLFSDFSQPCINDVVEYLRRLDELAIDLHSSIANARVLLEECIEEWRKDG